MRVLLVEDDDDIAGRLSHGLKKEGFIIERAQNGPDGLAMGLDYEFDVVILDLGLPELDGLEILKRWRSQKIDTPVLVLTARGTWTEKVEGLNAGADDYISKPTHVPEVAARLRALVRRKFGTASPVFQHGALSLDSAAGEVTLSGERVELTAIEIQLLNYFMHRIGRVLSQYELAESIYGSQDVRESNTVEVYISRLRRKLGRDVIKTIRGLGYKMD